MKLAGAAYLSGMRQLTYTKSRKLSFWNVPEPTLHGEGEALVRPFVAARCDGDAMFLRHNFERWLRLGARMHVVDALFSHARDDVFHGPFPYGHECVAEVLAVGNDVKTVAPGDVVVVPWSISCGHCGCCSRGWTAKCERSQTPLAAYGFSPAMGEHGGMVSDVLRVPYAEAMLVPLPTSVDPLAAASVSDNMTDAYRAVGPLLAERPGAPVLIVAGAAHSVGLYAAAIAVALGSSRVVYLDSKRERLEAAERVGAFPIEFTLRDRWFHRGKPVQSEGFPISVEASGSVSGMNYALHALAPGGTCTAVAFYLFRYTPLSLWQPYLNTCTLRLGVSHVRPHVPAVLELLERRAFDPLAVKPLIGGWSDADRVLLEPANKVIVHRSRLAVH